MEDFNEFIKNGGSNNKDAKNGKDLFGLISSLSKNFDGKSSDELIKAIYNEAKKGKKKGTLTNNDIDNFAKALSPFLDDTKQKLLNKIVKELKNI